MATGYRIEDDSMLEAPMDEEAFLQAMLAEASMWFEHNRLKTFTNWKFSEPSKCTAEAMAQAGFVHVPTDDSPDAVSCFFCFKELDGWDPDDDPWDEHVSHTNGKCKFLLYAQSVETTMTTKQYLELEIQRQQNKQKKKIETRKQRLKDQAALVRSKMEEMV